MAGQEKKSNTVLQAGRDVAEGAALGATKGGVAGAVVGGGKALLKKKNRKWLYIILVVTLLPQIVMASIIYSVFSSSNDLSAIIGGQAAQAVAASGVSRGNFDAYSAAADRYNVPWEVLAAIVYYESGPGYGAGEAPGTCPPNRTPWTEAYCPSVVPGTGTSGTGVPGTGTPSTGALAPASGCLPGATRPVSWAKPGRYSWTVPSGVTAISVDLVGGAGGGGPTTGIGATSAPGGPGGSVLGCAHVAPGKKLTIYVGAAGAPAGQPRTGQAQTSQYGSGYRAGGPGGGPSGANGGGGGGSSAVVAGTTLLAEAGGGGGGAGSTSKGGAGGAPGGAAGAAGKVVRGPRGAMSRAGGGAGAGQHADGCGAGPIGSGAGAYATGQCGSLSGDGGAGGPYAGLQGGGGGGGYHGGGGGSVEAVTRHRTISTTPLVTAPPVTVSSVSAGGGGSSWAAPGMTGASYGTQQVPGNGDVEISYRSGLGPFGLTPAAGILPAQAGNTAASAMLVAKDLQAALAHQPLWGKDNSIGFLASETVSSDGMTIDPGRWAAAHTMGTFVAALSQLPISGGSKTLDKNIYELATDWGLDQAPAGSGAPAADMVCGTWNAASIIVSGSLGAGTQISAAQMTNATVVVRVGQQMGLPSNALQIALGTALTESSLWDLPNASVSGSETDPNVQWGSYSLSNPPSNGTSVGLFQQQVGIWDGGAATVAEAMDPQWSAQSFYTALEGVPGWQSATTASQMGTAAQAVQASAYGARYQGWMPAAATLLGAVLQVPCQGTVSATGRAAIVVAAAEKWVGNAPYVWGGGSPTGPSGSAVGPAGYIGKPGFDCSGLVQYALAQVGIVVPHYSGTGGQFSVVQAAGGFTTNIAQLQPGDLVFFVGVGVGGTASDPGHVGIYIGNGEMVDAPYTGTLVGIDPVTQSTAGGFVGGGPAW